MSFVVSEDIERYAEAHTSPETGIFKNLARITHEQCELAVMQVGHLEGSFLRMIVKIARARRVLEIGTFTGYSALAMAEGLPDDGELIACDIDEATTRIAREHWEKSPHGHKIRLVLGPALETLDRLEGPFDVVFIDADKENYPNYWEKCLPKVAPGGLILVDNVFMGGRVLNPKDAPSRVVARFNEEVLRDPRVEAVMLTIRDGVTLARKKMNT